METLLRDIRYGVRSLLKRPGFTAIAVITLALGIGANTAIFSVVNAVLLRPLPYVEADQLVVPWGTRTNAQDRTNVSYPDFVDWQAQTKTLDHIAAYNSAGALLREGDADPQVISGAAVSADLFQLLKVTPVLGRSFTRAEDQANAAPVIVLGYELWQKRFQRRPEHYRQTNKTRKHKRHCAGCDACGLPLSGDRNEDRIPKTARQYAR